MYVVHGYGAVHFNYIKKDKEQFLHNLHRHRHERVFVIQKVYYINDLPHPALVGVFKLNPVLEYENTRDFFIRISQVEPLVR
jgi:hypothetical protein